MIGDGPAENPPKLDKLKAKRVQEHVLQCLYALRRSDIQRGCIGREATSSPSIISVEWTTLDLYTVALDLADDDELRNLVAQARSMLLRELLRRSESQRWSRCRDSSAVG